MLASKERGTAATEVHIHCWVLGVWVGLNDIKNREFVVTFIDYPSNELKIYDS